MTRIASIATPRHPGGVSFLPDAKPQPEIECRKHIVAIFYFLMASICTICLAVTRRFQYGPNGRRNTPVGPPVDVSSRAARRVLEQQSGQRALGQPQQEQPEQPEQQHRFPCGLFVHIFPVLSRPSVKWRRAGAPDLLEQSKRTFGVVRRPWFAGLDEEGKMARARPVRTAGPGGVRPSGIYRNRGAGRTLLPRRPYFATLTIR